MILRIRKLTMLFVFAEMGNKPSLDEKRSRSLEDKNDPTPENSKCKT